MIYTLFKLYVTSDLENDLLGVTLTLNRKTYPQRIRDTKAQRGIAWLFVTYICKNAKLFVLDTGHFEFVDPARFRSVIF